MFKRFTYSAVLLVPNYIVPSIPHPHDYFTQLILSWLDVYEQCFPTFFVSQPSTVQAQVHFYARDYASSSLGLAYKDLKTQNLWRDDAYSSAKTLDDNSSESPYKIWHV